MSEQRPQDSDFNFSSMDWQAYVAFRPIYPSALYSTIYKYHDSHNGQYDNAFDIGAGIGIVSEQLLRRFSRVVLSDASESYLSQAKSQFASTPPERMAFLQAKAEVIRIPPQMGNAKMDMVTGAMCLHWANLEVAMPKIAELLKPGGTFAAWVYGVRPIFPEQPSGSDLAKARQIFYDLMDKMCMQYDTQIGKEGAYGGAAQANSRLDCMPFNPELWIDVRRLHTRRDFTMTHAEWPSTPSRVREGETVAEFEDQDLLNYEADYEYLEGFLTNWIPPLNVPTTYKEELARLKEAMGTRKVRIVWPIALVLATRK